jgi:Kef-type K+ transport system membrane component KefB
MTSAEAFLLALLAVFALPWALWRLAGGGIRLPLVVVQIVVGILLGPGILGQLAPDAHGALFRPEVIQALNGVASWAVMIFIFLAGLELDLGAAWVQRRDTLVTAGAALVVPLALGSLVALGLVAGDPAWLGARGIGMATAVTALPILVLFLAQLDLLRAPLGQRVLRYASLDDVAIWTVLALILLDWDRLTRQFGFALIFLTLAPLLRRLIPRLRPADRWPVALIWLLGTGLVADWAGLHYMVGAFLAGAVLEARWFGTEAVDRLRDIVLVLLMPVFFLSTGLRTSWEMGGAMVVLAAGLLLAAAIAGKLLGVALAGRLLGWPRGEAWVIGWLLQTKALIMIIFANILLDKAVISGATFTALLLMALGSTVLTLPVVMPRLKRPG